MRKGVGLAVLIAAALVPAAAADVTRAPQAKPRLALGATARLTVKGFDFRRRERVLVVAAVGGERHARRVRATATGRFSAVFAEVQVDRCLGAFVTATGSRGSRATMKLPQPACPLPLSPGA